jgi:Fe2+ or Zn2+ uptake regulation protein
MAKGMMGIVIANDSQQGRLTMQDTIRRLHAQGGRMTTQRRQILSVLENMRGHPTAEEIYEVVRQHSPRLHLSTVYRTLRWLEQEGRVSARRFEEDPHQERFDYSLPSEHHHFQCTSCKRVIEFDNPHLLEVKIQFERETGAFVENTSLMLAGICSSCQQKNQKKSRQAVIE